MKLFNKITLTLAMAAYIATASAQAPTGVNYQAVARNSSGNAMVNKTIAVRMSILAGSASGTADYVEKHSVSTNQFGLFNLIIGGGSAQTGTFASVNWSAGSKFLKVEIDTNNGNSFTTLSSTQLMSVPYALYAEKSGSGGGGLTGSGTTNYLSKWNSSSSLNSSLIYENSGQISIGTTSPSSSSKFEVNTSNYDAVNGITSSTFNGVFGSNSGGGNGVEGTNSSSGNGVHGVNTSSGSAVFGESSTGPALYGTSTGGSGVVGICVTQNYAGVIGRNSTTSPGIYGANSGNGNGIQGFAAGTGYAGYFDGDVDIIGNLAKSSGSFKIDHPQDPANKYLIHSFVESPDMMNVYNGNITTDANGIAVVDLPSYFMAENKDFRYQLTPIGTFTQVIIFEEVKDNKFTIKTDKPNVKVSWQVTGIRQDAWANAHRLQVEVNKKDNEIGKYLHPELFGKPSSLSIPGLSRPFITLPPISQPKTLGKGN